MFNTLAGKFGGFAGGSVEPGTLLIGGVQHSLRTSRYFLEASNNVITLTNQGEPFVAKFYIIGSGATGGQGGRYNQGPNPGSAPSTFPSYLSAPTISTITASAGTGGVGGPGSPPGSGGGGGGGGSGGGGSVTNPGPGALVGLAGNAGSGGSGGSAGPSGTSGGQGGFDAASKVPASSGIYSLTVPLNAGGQQPDGVFGDRLARNSGQGAGGGPGRSEPDGGGGGGGGAGGGAYIEHQLTITPGVTYSMRAGSKGNEGNVVNGTVPGRIIIEFVS